MVRVMDTRSVLVVEDEPAVLRVIGRALGRGGYDPLLCPTAAEGRAVLAGGRADAMVLDLGLPDADGVALCRDLRETGCRLPILVVTARTSVGDRIAGLDAGADDYLPKPFDVDELVARLRALLRRAGPEHTDVVAGALRLDVADRRVQWADGRPVDLTHTEAALLATLMRHPGHALSRRELFEQAWGYDYGPGGGTLAVYVGYVRRKLASAGAPVAIRNVRGHGYALDLP
ncbi:MAG: response regulator transcription factor [Baekduiaceae bacterium]